MLPAAERNFRICSCSFQKNFLRKMTNPGRGNGKWFYFRLHVRAMGFVFAKYYNNMPFLSVKKPDNEDLFVVSTAPASLCGFTLPPAMQLSPGSGTANSASANYTREGEKMRVISDEHRARHSTRDDQMTCTCGLKNDQHISPAINFFLQTLFVVNTYGTAISGPYDAAGQRSQTISQYILKKASLGALVVYPVLAVQPSVECLAVYEIATGRQLRNHPSSRMLRVSKKTDARWFAAQQRCRRCSLLSKSLALLMYNIIPFDDFHLMSFSTSFLDVAGERGLTSILSVLFVPESDRK